MHYIFFNLNAKFKVEITAVARIVLYSQHLQPLPSEFWGGGSTTLYKLIGFTVKRKPNKLTLSQYSGESVGGYNTILATIIIQNISAIHNLV